jgi:hypothetical protein
MARLSGGGTLLSVVAPASMTQGTRDLDDAADDAPHSAQTLARCQVDDGP